MIELFVYPPAEGMSTASPYGLKCAGALKYLQVPHELRVVEGFSRRRLPMALVQGEQIDDSTAILRAIDSLHPGPSRLFPSDPELRADVLLLEDWADEIFAANLSYYRWMVDKNFASFAARAMSGIAAPLRACVLPFVRRKIGARLRLTGYALLSEEGRRARFREQLWMLEERLSKRAYLCERYPTAADFAVFGVLENILASKVPELTPLLLPHTKLLNWCDRMRKLSNS